MTSRTSIVYLPSAATSHRFGKRRETSKAMASITSETKAANKALEILASGYLSERANIPGS
jgi:hypothetical protein